MHWTPLTDMYECVMHYGESIDTEVAIPIQLV